MILPQTNIFGDQPHQIIRQAHNRNANGQQNGRDKRCRQVAQEWDRICVHNSCSIPQLILAGKRQESQLPPPAVGAETADVIQTKSPCRL